MTEKPMKVGEIAKTFGVDPNTVRNWCERYAEYLSDAAKPPTGGVRLFSSRDFTVLSFVNSALNGGMIHDEIAMKMAETSFNAGESDIILSYIDIPPPQTKITTQETQYVVIELPSTAIARFEAIERRLDARDRSIMLWGALWGAIAALGLGAFVLWVLWLVVGSLNAT